MTWSVTQANFGTTHNKASQNLSIKRGLAYHRRVYKSLEVWRNFHAPEQNLYVEPWLREHTGKLRQPDAVLVDPYSNTGVAIEVKMNWRDGRDTKLITEYLPAVLSAFKLAWVWPCLITSNVQGLKHEPLLGLDAILGCDSWLMGQPTPVVLFV